MLRLNQKGDVIARIMSALNRAKEAQDAQDWQRVKTILLLAIEAIDTKLGRS